MGSVCYLIGKKQSGARYKSELAQCTHTDHTKWYRSVYQRKGIAGRYTSVEVWIITRGPRALRNTTSRLPYVPDFHILTSAFHLAASPPPSSSVAASLIPLKPSLARPPQQESSAPTCYRTIEILSVRNPVEQFWEILCP